MSLNQIFNNGILNISGNFRIWDLESWEDWILKFNEKLCIMFPWLRNVDDGSQLYSTAGDGTWSFEDWWGGELLPTSLHHKVSEIMYRVHMKCLPSPSFLQMIPWDNPQLALYILYSEYFRFRLFYMACLYKVKGKDHLWNPHFRSIITQLRRTSKNHFNIYSFNI